MENTNCIYIINIQEAMQIENFDQSFQHLNYFNGKKPSYLMKEDSYRSALGEMMIRHIMDRKYGKNSNHLRFIRNEFGKPYLLKGDIYFNISHSGDFVVCTISDDEIGIDIEQIDSCHWTIVDKFFTINEKRYVTEGNKGEEPKRFCEIWTMKESYIKAIGRGFSIPIEYVRILKADFDEEIESSYLRQYYLIKSFQWYDYMISVSSKKQYENIRIISMNALDLYEYFTDYVKSA